MSSPVNGSATRSQSTRTYRSARREQQSAATRHAVLMSARALFTEQGYAATTVTQVAERARVSVDTLYASVGRKPQLLIAVHDMVLGDADEPIAAEQRDYVAAIREAAGARDKLRTYAEALGRVLPTVVPLAESMRTAAQTDPDCERVWKGLGERRAANMLLLARELRTTGELREDLSDEDVAHLIWTTNSPEFYQLTTAHGRSAQDYVSVVTDLWTRVLLG